MMAFFLFFFFKQKTAYEIGLGIPAEPLFRSTSFSHSTRNKTRDGLIRVRNIRALNGRFNTSITHAYSIVIGSKHITLNATGGGQKAASGGIQGDVLATDRKSGSAGMPRPISYACITLVPYTTLFRSPALAIAPETKLWTASSGLGTLEP